MTLVKTFMATAIHQTQEKSPRFSAMMLDVDFPTKDPICSFSSVERSLGRIHAQNLQWGPERQVRRLHTFPIASSRASVEANPCPGGNQDEKILY